MIGIRATNPHNLVCRRNEPSAIEIFRVCRQRQDTETGQDPHKSASVHAAAIVYSVTAEDVRGSSQCSQG